MCGITGYTGNDRAAAYLMKGLKKLEYRGYDSSGVALFEKRGINIIKAEGKLINLEKKLSGVTSRAQCGIGHTRWATHGSPDETNAHPHQSMGGTFTIVHNGVIENYLTLKNELVEKGFRFYSQTDTEVIANALEDCYSGNPLTAIKLVCSRLEGSFALGIICCDFPDIIFAAKKGAPLLAAAADSGNFIASDSLALREFTDEYYSLGENEAAIITKYSLKFFDFQGRQIIKNPRKITHCITDSEKDGYEHFMLKEIHQQPSAMRNTLNHLTKGEKIFPELKLDADALKAVDRICFVGCGSAYNAALSGRLLTEKLSQTLCFAETASEFRYGNFPITKNSLCIFISQSGETADTLAALSKAKEKGAQIISVVNVADSTMAKESPHLLLTKAGPEIAVATTKAYSAQLVTLFLFALFFAETAEKISAEEKGAFLRELRLIPSLAEELLSEKETEIEALSRLFTQKTNAYFIGRAFDYPTAVEGALKMKEVSYIHTEAYPSGELKHGTISLIRKGTPVVAVCCDEKLLSKTLTAVKEVVSRGAEALIITTSALKKSVPSDLAKIVLPCVSAELMPLISVIPLQLLSYYTAHRLGLEIDQPRNLAKSVTVE